jgi:hypothetical protein
MTKSMLANRFRTMPVRRLLPGLLLGTALAVSGCSRQSDRYFVYESGKINLERITYITPRIKAGVDEFPLTSEGIEKVLGNLRDGRYAFFDVQAVLMFDEFAWRAYQSRTFEKETPPTPADIADVKRGLKKALSTYRSIR